MRKNGIILVAAVFLLLFSVEAFGQEYGTLTFRADISGPAAVNDGGTWKIYADSLLEINIYANNSGGTTDRATWSSPFLFSGTGGPVNVTWGDTSTFVQASFMAYWDLFQTTYAESWDGDLTNDIGNGNLGDLFNYTGACLSACYPQNLGEQLIIKATLHVNSTSGTLWVKQGDAVNDVYDWLFDETTPPYPFFDSVSWPIIVPSDVRDRNQPNLPTEFALDQNHPNPFNPSTVIDFALPTASRVSVNIYNVLGQVVKTLVDKDLPAGYWSATWDGTDNAGNATTSGIYFYKIKAGSFQSTKKMMMLK
jgi:FlgD Ig-like domain